MFGINKGNISGGAGYGVFYGVLSKSIIWNESLRFYQEIVGAIAQ